MLITPAVASLFALDFTRLLARIIIGMTYSNAEEKRDASVYAISVI
jgi:hypothetical protein